ncbi:MAG: FGGY family carbohydrate kinase, partial [Christensenellales bacterium]
MKTIITIDAGTQSLRAGVLTVKGDILFSASRDYSPVFSPGNRAEQDPATWNSALFETLKDVGDFLQSTQEAQPDCIAITSQRASVIPVDAEG